MCNVLCWCEVGVVVYVKFLLSLSFVLCLMVLLVVCCFLSEFSIVFVYVCSIVWLCVCCIGLSVR